MWLTRGKAGRMDRETGTDTRSMHMHTTMYKASLKAQLVKSPPAMRETLVLFLCQEDPLEKG